MSLFPRRDTYICKLPGQDNWRTWTGPLKDYQILGVIQDGGRGILRGCHWADKTRFAVIDIDELSQYHNRESLSAIAQRLRSVGLNPTLYRSSDKGGWHCYLFFSNWEKSREVESTLKKWLKFLGYELKGGQLEVFPSGNALRLPLQPGFAWLDLNDCIIRTREEISLDEALGFFLHDQEENAASWAEARTCIESQFRAIETSAGSAGDEHQKAIDTAGFDDLYSYREIEEHCQKARQYLASGLIEKGTRHEAIYTIQHLLWHGDSLLGIPKLPGRKNAARRFQFLKDWIEQNHNGQCSHINRGDWRTIEAHIYRVVNWQRADLPALSNYEPYKATERAQERLFELFMATGRIWEMSDLKKANDDREQEARNKIKRAVGDCLQQGRQISRRTLEAITGCSPNTVRKHSDLWKLFALGSGVLISGGRGAVSDLSPEASLLDRAANESRFEARETRQEPEISQVYNLSIEVQPYFDYSGNDNNLVAESDYTEGKTLFILPYGAIAASSVSWVKGQVSLVAERDARKKEGSASVPLRQLACSEVLAAAEGGELRQSRRHNKKQLLYRILIDAGGRS